MGTPLLLLTLLLKGLGEIDLLLRRKEWSMGKLLSDTLKKI